MVLERNEGVSDYACQNDTQEGGSTLHDVGLLPPHYGCLHFTLLREVPKIPMVLERSEVFVRFACKNDSFWIVILSEAKDLGRH